MTTQTRANVRATVLVALVAMSAVTLVGCGKDKDGGTTSGGLKPLSAITPNRSTIDPQPIVPGASDVPFLGRVPWFRFTNHLGKAFGLDDLQGKVWVGTFMFTRCRATCPLQAEKYATLQGELADSAWGKAVQFVSFSVDPENDTPDVLRAYGESYGGVMDVWTLLTGPRRRIWQLSTRGFHLPAGDDPKNEAMPIGHSAKFALVDRRGLIRGYFDSQTDEGIDALTAALAKVSAEPAPEFVTSPEAVDWIEARAKAQKESTKDWTVRHDFSFREALWDSGIRFLNRCVDDVGRDYRGVHYDHGTGVLVADVDGDDKLDLFFVNQVGSNGLFRNKGDGTFEDITKKSGLAMKHDIGVSAAFADTDNDGDPDLYITTVRSGNRFFVNDGTGRFEDQTTKAGLEYVGHSSSADFFDFDNDGLLDLFVTNVGVYTIDQAEWVVNDSTTVGRESGAFKFLRGMKDAFSGQIKPERNEASLFYRNLGDNKFENITKQAGIYDVSWSGDASPVDLNRDGWTDLYVVNMQGHDEYYENHGGKKFVKRSRELFPNTPWGAMCVKAFDMENDGDFDLFITDMHSDMSQLQEPSQEKLKSHMIWPESLLRSEGKSIWGNALFRQSKPDVFEEVSDSLGAENYWPWGFTVADLNADGFQDVFITASMNYPFRYGINSLLLNDGGKRFLDSEFVLGVEPREGTLFEPAFALDCGGRGQSHRICERKGDALIVVSGARGTRSSVVFDIDGDGDLDIVANDFNYEPMILKSSLAQSKPGLTYLSIQLEGTKSNRDGLGAIVTVFVGDRSLMQRHDGQSGYLAQSSAPLYFGLNTVATVRRVEVDWPSGAKQTVKGPIAANQTLSIKEQ